MTAPTFTNLDARASSSVTSLATPSYTPTAQRLLLFTVCAYISTGSAPPATPTVSGNGLTWNLWDFADVDTSGADRSRMWIFWAVTGASPTTGAVTASFGAVTMTRIAIDLSTSDANVDLVNPIIQGGKATSASTTTTQAATLPNTMISGNSAFFALGQQGNTVRTPKAGWTELSDVITTTTNSLETQYIAGTDTGGSASWTTAVRAGAMVLEISAPVAGPTVTTFETADWTGTGATKTITITGAAVGDLIVVMFGGDGFNNAPTAASVSTTAGPGATGSWSEPVERLNATNQGWQSSSAATVTTAGSITVTLSRTQSAAQVWGGYAALLKNHGGVGVTAFLTNGTADAVSVAGISQDSVILMMGVDWDHVAAVAMTPSGAIDVERNAALTAVTWYANYWRGQASGTRNYGMSTNASSNNFSMIAVEVLAAGAGTTPIGKDLELDWSVRAALGDSLQAIWNTRAAVGDDIQAIWNVRASVGKSNQLVWNTRAVAGQSVQALWNTRAPAGKDLQLVWNVLSPLTAVGKDLSLLWFVRAAIGDPLALSWSVRSAVGDPLALQWSVRSAIGDPLQVLWNVRAGVGGQLDLRWGVSSLIGDSLALQWSVRQALGDSLSMLWNTRASVGDDLQLIWDVDSIVPMTAIGKDLALQWAVRQAVGDPLDLRWSTRAAIGDTLSLAWALRAAMGKNLSLVWNTRAIVSDTLDLRWGVRTTIGAEGSYLWAVRAMAGKSLIMVWNTEGTPYDPIQDPFSSILRNASVATILRNRGDGSVSTTVFARVRPNDAEARPE